MPIRVKSKVPHGDGPLRAPSPGGRGPSSRAIDVELPDISDDDSFRMLVKKLSVYIAAVVDLPVTFEQLRTTAAGDGLRALVDHLGRHCTHPAIVNALLALKWHYGEATEDKDLNNARAAACEIVAWRFLTHLSEREVVDYCLYELPGPVVAADEGRGGDEEDELGGPTQVDEESGGLGPEGSSVPDERTSLLGRARAALALSYSSTTVETANKRNLLISSISRLTMSMTSTFDSDGDGEEDDDPTAHFASLNALEIAAIANAKRFLAQPVVQKIITGIWNGNIIFWDTLSVDSVKKPRFYKPATADPFSRLRVPKYLKSYEVVFFLSFLFLYYAVLVERDPMRFTTLEVFLCIWLAAFAYDEFGEWLDAGSVFYATDVWNIFDLFMIGIGFTYFVMRVVGLKTDNTHLVETAFDVLALEALFMVPRVFSILSLSPYWGTLIPCLKEMGKDFIKFMVLVVVIYFGFLTTFSLVGRDSYTFNDMTGFLTRIFFGSSATGFDIMHNIDPVFGPPLMIIFVILSSILLTGSLTGMLSNSFSRVITHAREEYLYVYSVYVLEASTSNRLTHFYPPFNLLALVFRPLRLLMPGDINFRRARIFLLKATHLPIVAAIELYEWLVRGTAGKGTQYNGFRGPRYTTIAGSDPVARKQRHEQYHRQEEEQQPKDAVASRVEPHQRYSQAFNNPSADVEQRIEDLATKIDRLTELVLALQAQQAQKASSDVGDA